MNDLHPILDHFIASILDIATRTAIAGCVPNQLNVFILITAKGSLAFPHRSQAFPASTGSVTVTNDDPDFRFLNHGCFPSHNNQIGCKTKMHYIMFVLEILRPKNQ
jgi:hypothetical protein